MQKRLSATPLQIKSETGLLFPYIPLTMAGYNIYRNFKMCSQEFSTNTLGRKFGSLAIGKKRKGSKLTPNKENQEQHEAKKEKEVKDALKGSPYR